MPSAKRDLPIMAFKSQSAWDIWLASHSGKSKGLWLKLAKKSSGIASVSHQEAVEAALCHGWIDGQGDAFDERYWLIRFTPRKPKSIWSQKNRAKALQLIEQGRMKPAGLREIEKAKKDGRWDSAYAPQSTAAIPDDLRAALAKNRKAGRFFETLDSRNRYAILHRVHTAKKAETRAQRVKTFVSMLSRGETIYPRKRKS